MGVDMFTRVYKYNKDTNLYDELKIYRRRKPNEIYEYYDEKGNGIPYKDDYVWIQIDVGRQYEMFEGMRNGTEKDGFGYFPTSPIALNSLAPEAREELEKDMKMDGVYDFSEISLLEIAYYLDHHPTVIDYDAPEWNYNEDLYKEPFEKLPQMENPIKRLYEEIFNYIHIAEEGWMKEALNYYKVIFYFGC